MGQINIRALCVNICACEEKNKITDTFSSEGEITKKRSHTIEEVLDSIEESSRKIEDKKTNRP